MENLKLSLISTGLHALELAFCLVASVFIVRYFKLGSDETAVVVGVVLDTLSKFARAADFSPVPDFVNDKPTQQ